jgi:hypothetical protein
MAGDKDDSKSDIDDSKSTSDMIFFLGDNAATWNSQKQRVMALSSCEAEYIAGIRAACQAVWLRRLMEEVLRKRLAAPRIKLDNQSAITLGKNPVLHDRSYHIKMKYHFIRECVEQGEISIELSAHRHLDEATSKGEVSRITWKDWSCEAIIIRH